jgi:hypothetical protein
MSGNDVFKLNAHYINSSQDTFNVGTLRYILSNFKLKKGDTAEVSLPNTYFLIDFTQGSSFTLSNVPFGNYSGMEYLIGVDSMATVSGAQTGALDPINDMFWTWATGYINFQMTGTSSSSSATGHLIDYHIGGFRYPYATQQPVTHSFGTSILTVRSGTIPKILLSMDVLEFFKNPVDISIKNLPELSVPGSKASMVANNYKDMFQFKLLSN